VSEVWWRLNGGSPEETSSLVGLQVMSRCPVLERAIW